MIREALQSDVKRIFDLGNSFNKNFSQTYNIPFYIDSNDYLVLVNVDNDINAFLIILKNIDNFDVEMLFVEERYRRKKIATKLLLFFINNYINGKTEIFLEVAVNNNKAIALYKKMEFEIINVRKKYYKNIDAYVMRKVI